MRLLPIAILAAVAAVPAAAADTVTYNGTPEDGWFFSNGNDYSPANTAVLGTDAGDEIYLRAHQTYQPAPASSGSTYSFGLGTDPLSFDWGIDNDSQSEIRALLTIVNLEDGQTLSYDPFFAGNDNEYAGGSAQNSFRFNWAGIGFDPNINNTYSVTLSVANLGGQFGSRDLTIFAKVGSGAVSPVPEPSAWALMILGFGLVGGGMRRRSVRVRYA